MKRSLPIILVILVATIALIFVGLTVSGRSNGTVGIASGSALPGFGASATTPEEAMSNFLLDIQKRNWDRAFATIERTSDTLTEQAFMQDWTGSNGGLRSFSSLEKYDARPLHASDSDAEMRVRLYWTTPVGPVEDVRDFRLAKRGGKWLVVWDETPPPNVPAQVVPVTYLRWDLVSGNSSDQWGSHNVDGPRVRIVSMNAVDSAEGTVVMGEVVNEDTIPAFVNVNATLIGASEAQSTTRAASTRSCMCSCRNRSRRIASTFRISASARSRMCAWTRKPR